jgi:hypothetical protein
MFLPRDAISVVVRRARDLLGSEVFLGHPRRLGRNCTWIVSASAFPSSLSILASSAASNLTLWQFLFEFNPLQMGESPVPTK